MVNGGEEAPEEAFARYLVHCMQNCTMWRTYFSRLLRIFVPSSHLLMVLAAPTIKQPSNQPAYLVEWSGVASRAAASSGSSSVGATAAH